MKMHKDALAFKNTILKYFPRATIGGVETFGSMITWAGTVIKDNAHRRVYHVLGMSIKSMEKQNYSGLDYTYIHLNAYTSPNGVITQDDIRNYIVNYSPLICPTHTNVFNPSPTDTVDMNPDPNKGTTTAYWDSKGWITVYLTYQPTTIDLIDNAVTDSQIIQKVKDISPKEIFYDVHENSRLTGLAMMDIVSNAVFETQLQIVNKTVALKDQLTTSRNIGRVNGISDIQARYVKSARIELKFRRTTDISVGHALSTAAQTYIALLDTTVEALASTASVTDSYGVTGRLASRTALTSLARDLQSSVNQQLVIMANWKNPYPNNHTLVSTDTTLVYSYYAASTETAIKVSGLIDLPPKQFKKTFLSLLKFDYKVHEKKGRWYDKVVSIVILVVAIAFAIVASPVTGGTSWGAVAVALSIGAIAEGVWAMYLVKNGGGTGAIHTTMGLSNVLGIAALVAGITAIYQQWAAQSLKQSTTEAAKQQLESAIAADAGSAVNSEAVTIAGNTYAEAFAASSQGSIGSLIGESVAGVANLGSKLGVIDNDMIGQVAGLAGGGYDMLQSAGTTQLSEITLQSVENNIKDGVTKFFSKPLGDILNTCVNWINAGFNAYVSLIAPANEGLSDKMAQLDKLEKEVQSTSPDNMDNTWTAYTDPYGSVFEVGDQFDKTYIMLTSGKNRSLMNQCYDSGYKI